MRQIVLDTETTGLEPQEGHRIIEIGCVELVNRKLTGKRYHVYINPDRIIDQGAVAVHGLDNAFLKDKPLFGHIVADFISFVDNAELIIHNAPFDVGFINAELRRLEETKLPADKRGISDYCRILDTLALAKKKHPGQRNSLDALCKRYNVSNSHRELHGALLDAEILAEVYLAMTGGQAELLLEPETGAGVAKPGVAPVLDGVRRSKAKLAVVPCSEAENAAHEALLAAIDKSSGGRCVWTH
jgi:DNA polymerase-3 subunit epsilon